jgi:hypothetical protein
MQNVAELVSRLFPGGEARQAQWLRDAAAIRTPGGGTMAPPAPVPIASSSLLAEGSASVVAPPTPSDPEVTAPAPPPPNRASGPKRKRKKKRKKQAETAPLREPPENRKRMWVIVAMGVAIFVVFAILASR